MKAIFTICAKNYLAQAKTLGYSIKKYCPDAHFYILLSDEIENVQHDNFNIIESKSLDIPNFWDLAFKYDVVEFSTAIKPYFIDILINRENFEKVIYIDPDMVLYSSPNFIFEELNNYDAIITPHIIKPYIDFNGATPEEEILFVGIFNLGFFAINNTTVGKTIINWWKTKLKNQCFADKIDALHVDQKWMDFLPSLYGDRIKILKHSGMNVAFWNIHERTIVDDGASYFVDNSPLVLFHFSGFDISNYEAISRKQTKFNLTNRPELTRLFQEYVSNLKKNGVENLSKLEYKYNKFNNGYQIFKFQRRLYRSLNLSNNLKKNPFETSENSFYHLLQKNNLIIFNRDSKYQSIRKSVDNIENKIKSAQYFLLLLKKVIGIRRYHLLMRFLNEYSRFEYQIFLIRKK